jgi:glutaredoxin 3
MLDGDSEKAWPMAEVLIYTRLFCGYCGRAKALLDKKGVAYREIDAGDDPAKRKEMIQRANGASTYPQIVIDGRPIGGSDELHSLERAGKLDALLNGARNA